MRSALHSAFSAVMTARAPGPNGPVRAAGACIRRLLASIPGALIAASALTAQAKPSVASDSIIKVALDSARGGDRAFVILLEDAVVRLDSAGRGTRTYRNVVQVLQPAGVAQVAERRFSWQPSRQDLTVDWVRVLRRDGTVVSDAPATDQSADATAAMQNPIYTDGRTRRLSLAGVAPGTIIDVQFTIVEKEPWRAGDFFVERVFSPSIPTRAIRLQLETPATYVPRIVEENLTFRRVETVQNSTRRYVWSIVSPPLVRPEPFAADSNGVLMRVQVGAPDSWADVTRWYNALATPSYTVPANAAATLDSVVASATSRRDTLEQLHRYIAQDVRYVSVSLGLGGYQPRAPLDVITAGYGDCKDKATLFVAAARRWGIDARQVLPHLNGVRTAAPVSIARFNHAIAAVREADGTYTFTDLTARYIPYGNLPQSYRGSFGVVVQPDGGADTVRFPQLPASENGFRVSMNGTLAPDGMMTLRVSDEQLGDAAWALRGGFATPLDSTRRAAFLRNVANASLPDATGDSLVAFDGGDFSEPVRVQYTLRGGRGARSAGPVWLLQLPRQYRNMVSVSSNLARELAAQPRRQFPIDAARILGLRTMEFEMRVTLPDGWTAQLPSPVQVSSFFGRYESRYAQQGNQLVLYRRTVGGPTGVHAPERIAEVIAWMQAVSRDDHEYIALTPAP